MRHLFMGLLVVSIPLACSAGGGAGKTFPSIGNGTGGSAAGSTGTGSTVGAGSTVGTGGFIAGTGGAVAGSGGADASACPRTVSQPEQIITYQDATVTDTIVTYSPIAIYIMQDRSGSMVTGFPTGSAQSWGYATTAITQFVNDPASSGLYVGLGSFPPYPSNAASNCSTDCNTPDVPIASLPGNAQNIANAYNTLTPGALNFTPTECGLNGIAAACSAFEATSPGMPCVGLLITDGQPDACNTTVSSLASILSTAASQGTKTFVIAMNGVTDITFLNTLAQAGGTNSAIDLTQSNSSAAIVTALDTVRQKISTSVSSQVVTQTVVSTALPCDWKITGTITPSKTNLEFTPDTTASPPAVEQFGHLPIPLGADPLTVCNTAAGDAWYYDSETNPTKVSVCPATCTKIKSAPHPVVNLIFGCNTVEVPIH